MQPRSTLLSRRGTTPGCKSHNWSNKHRVANTKQAIAANKVDLILRKSSCCTRAAETFTPEPEVLEPQVCSHYPGMKVVMKSKLDPKTNHHPKKFHPSHRTTSHWSGQFPTYLSSHHEVSLSKTFASPSFEVSFSGQFSVHPGAVHHTSWFPRIQDLRQ